MIWQDYAIIVLMVLGAWPVIMYYEAKGKKAKWYQWPSTIVLWPFTVALGMMAGIILFFSYKVIDCADALLSHKETQNENTSSS